MAQIHQNIFLDFLLFFRFFSKTRKEKWGKKWVMKSFVPKYYQEN
jgi:hypothetical protein